MSEKCSTIEYIDDSALLLFTCEWVGAYSSANNNTKRHTQIKSLPPLNDLPPTVIQKHGQTDAHSSNDLVLSYSLAHFNYCKWHSRIISDSIDHHHQQEPYWHARIISISSLWSSCHQFQTLTAGTADWALRFNPKAPARTLLSNIPDRTYWRLFNECGDWLRCPTIYDRCWFSDNNNTLRSCLCSK